MGQLYHHAFVILDVVHTFTTWFAHGGEKVEIINFSHPLQSLFALLIALCAAITITAAVYLISVAYDRRKHPDATRQQNAKKHWVNWSLIVAVLAVLIFIEVTAPLVAGTSSPEPNAETTQAPVSTITPSATVTLTKEGHYSPAIVTIKPGQAVRFINHSGNLMWPASNPHPNHSDYPGFDPKKILHDGDTWQFTFTRSGHWGYHDHLNPMRRGTVVVQE